MSIAEALAQAGAKSKGKRPQFLKDPQTEQVLAITMAVAQELAVMRERMDTIERLLDEKGVVTRDEIEEFQPTKYEAAERGLWTQEYLSRILRVVQQDAEAMAAGAEPTSEAVGKRFSKG
ncbi:MAG: hypothetical protein AAF719_08805 [Pseudomonadota bacterium]